jgi:hypothetical protein
LASCESAIALSEAMGYVPVLLRARAARFRFLHLKWIATQDVRLIDQCRVELMTVLELNQRLRLLPESEMRDRLNDLRAMTVFQQSILNVLRKP